MKLINLHKIVKFIYSYKTESKNYKWFSFERTNKFYKWYDLFNLFPKIETKSYEGFSTSEYHLINYGSLDTNQNIHLEIDFENKIVYIKPYITIILSDAPNETNCYDTKEELDAELEILKDLCEELDIVLMEF